MPKINNTNGELKCYLCKRVATHIAYNSKRFRCREKVTQCPGFIKKAEAARKNNVSIEQRRKHMKQMSVVGNKKLKELHKNDVFVKQKGKNISKSIIARGGHIGENNPMFGKKHKKITKQKMKESAALRDNTFIGKYERTNEHKDNLSRNMTERIKTGKTKQTHTKPELAMINLLEKNAIDFEFQYLIQFGPMTNRFRHLYDFRINDTDVLIEVDGDYWHSRQETKLRDRLCESTALDQDLRVLRFSESYVMANANNNNVIEEIKKFIASDNKIKCVGAPLYKEQN